MRNVETKALPLLLMVACYFLSAHAIAAANDGEKEAFRFFAFGDMPYHPEDEDRVRQFLQSASKEDFQFFVHVGDIKSGESPCDDPTYGSAFDLLQDLPVPVVYTPGDNEWTDCHREACGNYDPVERLAYLRKVFFSNRSSLKLDQLGVTHLNASDNFQKFSEIYRFKKSGILFVVLHIVGSNNNLVPSRPSTLPEFKERNAANLYYLKDSFALAEKEKAKGLVLILHANPGLENTSWHDTSSWQKGSGFHDFLETLYDHLLSFRQPVLLIHGDSHYFRVDKPIYFKGTGKVIPHFTRAEVFGESNIHGLAVSVNPNDPQVFTINPYINRQ